MQSQSDDIDKQLQDFLEQSGSDSGDEIDQDAVLQKIKDAKESSGVSSAQESKGPQTEDDGFGDFGAFDEGQPSEGKAAVEEWGAFGDFEGQEPKHEDEGFGDFGAFEEPKEDLKTS